MTNAAAAEAVAKLQDAGNKALVAGNPRAAADFLQQALALAPDRLDLWMGLAASQRRAGDLVAAVASVDGALEQEPRFFPALLMKGSLLDALGRTADAAKL